MLTNPAASSVSDDLSKSKTRINHYRNPNSVTSILLLALFREEKAISEVLNSGFTK